jgi:glycosyltransferase involved in cell wall biosynthesis
MTKPKLSVVVITFNEADRISALLHSTAFADEVIVVDSGSTDDTAEVCKAAGALIFVHSWQGYAEQKQYALERASGEWILNLDADERVSESLNRELLDAIRKAPPEICGFTMPRLSRYLGTWIHHGGWYPDRKLRLSRNGCGIWKGDGLHEKLVVNGKIMDLSHPILHDVYRNISDQIHTIDKFSDTYAAKRSPAGAWFVAVGVSHAIGKFFECYLWKRGFLDGTAGLVIAMNSAWYIFLKHAKVWEKSLSKSS